MKNIIKLLFLISSCFLMNSMEKEKTALTRDELNKKLFSLVKVASDLNSDSRQRVKQLLDQGADVNAKDVNGKTVLRRAILDLRAAPNISIIKLLFEKGAEIDKDLYADIMQQQAIFRRLEINREFDKKLIELLDQYASKN